jgi:diaminopimelate epimerase
MIEFAKMHGAGNDFVVIDCISQAFAMTPALARAIADRHRGIGCDQILLVDPPPTADVDFGYRIFNADGGEVEQCGNGARCFVRFVHERGLTTKRSIRVATRSGVIEPRLRDDGDVSVVMGEPEFVPERVPFDRHALTPQVFGRGGEAWPVEVDGRRVPLAVLSMGNPHAVQLVADVDSAAVGRDGPLIEHNPRFPARVNAGFMQVVDPHRIRLRVYERGAGETLSCGTGACAAAVAGIRSGLLQSPVEVETRGGKLTIEWPREHNSVVMTGPAVTVYAGQIDFASLLNKMSTI